MFIYITPNIYTVSQNTTDVTVIPELYYRVMRTYDDFEVIPFGTGSTKYTKLSYDASGSYFDFDFGNFSEVPVKKKKPEKKKKSSKKQKKPEPKPVVNEEEDEFDFGNFN